MKKTPDSINKPKQILCFNKSKILAAVFASYRDAERITKGTHPCIAKACHGEMIMAYGKYWRELDSDIIIESDDIGTLTLPDYDVNIVHHDRLIYRSNTSTKKREKIFSSDFLKLKQKTNKKTTASN